MATTLYKAQYALKTCDEHEHQELSYFCRTCKKFICTLCVKTSHNGHDWDLISHVAKSRRMETPILCRKIEKENLPRYRQKLRGVDDNISAVEKWKDDDVSKLEKRRTDIMKIVNSVIDDKRRTREELSREEILEMKDERQKLSKKVEYLEKLSNSLNVNIGEYSDHDVIEMEQVMLSTKEELASYDIKNDTAFIELNLGEMNEEIVEKMVGEVKKNKSMQVKDHATVHEIKSYNVTEKNIFGISPLSDNQAWIHCGGDEIKLLTIQNIDRPDILTRRIQNLMYFTISRNGDLIVTDCDKKYFDRLNSMAKKR